MEQQNALQVPAPHVSASQVGGTHSECGEQAQRWEHEAAHAQRWPFLPYFPSSTPSLCSPSSSSLSSLSPGLRRQQLTGAPGGRREAEIQQVLEKRVAERAELEERVEVEQMRREKLEELIDRMHGATPTAALAPTQVVPRGPLTGALRATAKPSSTRRSRPPTTRSRRSRRARWLPKAAGRPSFRRRSAAPTKVRPARWRLEGRRRQRPLQFSARVLRQCLRASRGFRGSSASGASLAALPRITRHLQMRVRRPSDKSVLKLICLLLRSGRVGPSTLRNSSTRTPRHTARISRVTYMYWRH